MGESDFSYQYYRWFARFAEVLPARWVEPLSRCVGYIAPLLFPERTRVVRAHLRRIMRTTGTVDTTGLEPSNALVRKAYASYARYWFDAFRLPTLSEAHVLAHIDITGKEYLDEVLQKDAGVVFLLAHIGNWDVAGAYYADAGNGITVVVEELATKKLRKWFRDFRQDLGMHVIFNSPSIASEIAAAVHRKDAIALLADRDVDGTGRMFDFFGEPTKLPVGPAMIALRHNVPILMVSCYQRPNGRHELMFEEPLYPQRNGTFGQDVERTMHNVVAKLEHAIRREPTQWHVFVPNWPSEMEVR